MEQAFLDFIGEKCVEVLKEVTNAKASSFKAENAPKSYIEGHKYETEILERTSRIILQNLATNQFGEYISEYIEYGTGVYAEESKAPDGWTYPTVESDKNTTKRIGKDGELYAFTKGQTAKNIYSEAMAIIERKLDEWIEEYRG